MKFGHDVVLFANVPNGGTRVRRHGGSKQRDSDQMVEWRWS